MVRSPLGQHKHEDCPLTQMEWLPPSSPEVERVPLQHKPFCKHCGVVKNIGSDRARKLGYFATALGRLRTRIDKEHDRSVFSIAKLTEAQVRFVIKRIEAVDGFDDPYAMTFSAQQRIFEELVRSIRPDIPVAVLEECLARQR
jgi:hypothetical protein